MLKIPSWMVAVSANLGLSKTVVLLATAWVLGAEKAGLSCVLALSSSVTLGKCPDLSLTCFLLYKMGLTLVPISLDVVRIHELMRVALCLAWRESSADGHWHHVTFQTVTE